MSFPLTRGTALDALDLGRAVVVVEPAAFGAVLVGPLAGAAPGGALRLLERWNDAYVWSQLFAFTSTE